jgi:hypothetical protein
MAEAVRCTWGGGIVRSPAPAASIAAGDGSRHLSKILYLRQTYHFGPGKIADYLKRFHPVAVARSSVHRILGRHGMNRLPANQKHQPRFIDDVRRRLSFRIHVIQSDNGAEFQSQFHWHVEALDMRHVYIRPRTPHLNGKVERSHRVDDRATA